MRLIYLGIKSMIFAAVVLMLGQIQIGQRNVCEYAGIMSASEFIQKPVHWVSGKFNIAASQSELTQKLRLSATLKQKGKEKSRTTQTDKDSGANSSEFTVSERNRLESLLSPRD